ncbi:hypothetical protein B0H63DRAFT_275190 [Podospora didyma]|uniref:Zn(2)-C6 fungal-type domain-containing protein n=1 Tax=Podospora didyma TaxID=330526 RepID=A0AAE0KF11_9PEZI|nr:hypothetical protein B0H63DRAFT_275190 [Podospora didyma]
MDASSPTSSSAKTPHNKGPRACATCARAKSRCIAGPDGAAGNCERCHRLKKPCSSQTPAPPRKRKEPKPTRVAELERRLEDLSARIESAQSQPLTPPDTETTIPGSRTSQPKARLQPPNARTWQTFQHLFPFPEPDDISSASPNPPSSENNNSLEVATETLVPVLVAPRARPNPPPPQHKAYQQTLWPEGDEAEALLAEHTTHLAHLTPFAVVPPHLTSLQFRQLRPFFWKAVMMEAYHLDGARQVALGNELLREITEAAFVNSQKDLDLLHGIQVLVAWYHYNLKSNQITNLLFLARSICASLGIGEPQGAAKMATDYSSLETMRAFAGTYYLVTVSFTTNHKPDALMNTTPYLLTCCQVLESRMEYPTDEILVWLVRQEQLSQSISQTVAYRGSNFRDGDLPLAIVIKSFQQQLQSFKSLLPPHIAENPSLIGHMYAAEILLYEISLKDMPGVSDMERLELLWLCVHSTNAFLTNRFAEEVHEHPRFICMSSFDFIYAFITALKLITLKTPGWDLPRVRQALCFDHFVERQVKDMMFMAEKRRRRRIRASGDVEPSAAEERAAEEEDPFLKLAKKMRGLASTMRSELEAEFGTGDICAHVATNQMPMTMADATADIHDLMQDIETSLWQDISGTTGIEFDSMFYSNLFFPQ